MDMPAGQGRTESKKRRRPTPQDTRQRQQPVPPPTRSGRSAINHEPRSPPPSRAQPASEAKKRRGRPAGKGMSSTAKETASTTRRGADQRTRGGSDQQDQPGAATAAARNPPAPSSPSAAPRFCNPGRDAGESAAGARPRDGGTRRAGGGGDGGESSGESGDDPGELTAAEAERMMSAAEERLLRGMVGGAALPESAVSGDEGGGGDVGAAGGGGEGGGDVDAGVEHSGGVGRNGAGCQTVAWKRASIEDVGSRCCAACFSERLRCEEGPSDRCKRCLHLDLTCVFRVDREFGAGSSSSSSPWTSRTAAGGDPSAPLPSSCEDGVVFLEGGFEEGDWDELDFALEAVPIGGREEPVAEITGRVREKLSAGAAELPWCRWMISRIGFSPPMGRPGKAQLAGLRPGDELSHLHPEPGVRLEAGLLGRQKMDRELSRLAAWSRSRKKPVGRGRSWRQRRSMPGGDVTETADGAGGRYDEADFPWKLEFRRLRRQPPPPRRRAQAGSRSRDEGCVSGGFRGGPSLARSASLTFRVFRETGWVRGGGQTFCVRVEEDEGHEEQERASHSGRARRVYDRVLEPPAPRSPEPEASVTVTDSLLSGKNPTGAIGDGKDGNGDGGDGGSAQPSSTAAAAGDSGAGAGVGSGGGSGNTARENNAAVDGHGDDENGAEGGGGGGHPAAGKEGCGEKALEDPLRLLCLSSGQASMVRRRAGLDGARIPDVHAGGEVSRGCAGSDVDRCGTGRDGGDGDGSGDSVGGDSGSCGGVRGGCLRGATKTGRDGEERITLAFRVSGSRDADFRVGVGAYADRDSHLLAGLTPNAVRLVKERIFSFARVAYARLYGLRGAAAAIVAGEVGADAVSTVDDELGAAWWEGREQEENDESSGTGAGDGRVHTTAGRQAGYHRGVEENEEEEEGQEDDDFSLVSKGKGKRRAVFTADAENCPEEEEEEEKEADGRRQNSRKRARPLPPPASSGAGPQNTLDGHADKGGHGRGQDGEKLERSDERAGKRQRAGSGKAAAMVTPGQAPPKEEVDVDGDGDFSSGGGGGTSGIRPCSGAISSGDRDRALAELDVTGNLLPEVSVAAAEPVPGSGALAEWVREFVRTQAFLSWVDQLRRADAGTSPSYTCSFPDSACFNSDEWVEDECARGRGPVVSCAGRTRDGGGGCDGGGFAARERDPFVFVARFKGEAEGNLRWSCDYCTRERKEGCDGDGATPCGRCRRLSLTCRRTLPARDLRARVSVPAFPAGYGRENLRLGVKDAVSRLLPSWNRGNQARKGQRWRRRDDDAPETSFPAAVSRLLRGAPAPAQRPAGRRRCWPRSDDLQHALTLDANMHNLHRAWRAKMKWEEGEEGFGRRRRVARKLLRPGGSGEGVVPPAPVIGGLEDKQDEVAEEGEKDGEGSGGRSGDGAVAGGASGKGVGKGSSSSWRKDERVLGMKEWRVPPTCYICHLPLASACECTAGSLEVERQFWEQRVAVVAGRPFQIPLGMLEYDDARMASAEVTPKRDTIAEHRRGSRANFTFRLEHAVSMQHRGLLRYPLAVEPLPPPPPPPPPQPSTVSRPAARGRDEGDETPASPSSLRPTAPAADGSEASMAADGRMRAGGDGGDGSDDMAVAAGEGDIAGAAESEDDESDEEDTLEPAAGEDPSPLSPSEAAPVEARPAASPSSPRLEKWPGFPCPSEAFARAAPVENPKGVLPPSPDVLRFIHQVASAKAEGTPALYGTLDESALLAVGVLVEEMLEELVSPLVDGRTRGYKNAGPAALARELAILRRTEQRHSSAAVPQPPMRPDASVGGSGVCATTVASSSAREEEVLGVVFGAGFRQFTGRSSAAATKEAGARPTASRDGGEEQQTFERREEEAKKG
eukprot:g3356.t1